MNYLSNEELYSINGGAIKLSAVCAVVGAGIVFLIGLVSGITRPYTCVSNKQEVHYEIN